MKIILTLIVIGLLTGFIANFFFAKRENDFSKIQIAENIWDIEVVSGLKERVKGLGGRVSLGKDSGMLFIFPESDFYGIWMKDMNFSIDIIWIDENLHVVDIKENATPESFPEVFKPESMSLYVLEINAGEAEKAKIKIGSEVKIF
jgi:uncharacterized protein